MTDRLILLVSLLVPEGIIKLNDPDSRVNRYVL